jgi:hypothetical protein
MNLQDLTDDQKVRLLEQVMKKNEWAKSKKSLKYLCHIELKTGKFIP